jgi:Fic family protein
MALENCLKEIAELKARIDALGKLDNNTLTRINYKFRLDWNFNSNSIEGNTLTKAETNSVMLNNVTVEGKPLKDVLEMSGHNDVVSKIQNMAKGDINITENRIKEIHVGIMHEDDPEKKKEIGRWKTKANYLYNYKDERIDFTPPENVAGEMNSLINWLNNELDLVDKRKSKLTILEIAAQLHLRFVTIHPFYDGNGRMSRILMNLVLIRYGYPPVIVKVEDKKQYGQYLAHAQEYEKNPVPFYEMMGALLIRSLERYFTGAKGEDISEPDDFDKELQQIDLKLKNNNAEVVKRNPELMAEVFTKSIRPLSDSLYEKLIGFNRFFAEFTINIYSGSIGVSGTKETVDQKLLEISKDIHANEITISYQWGGFNRAGANTFWMTTQFKIRLREFDYLINERQHPVYKEGIKKLYSQQLTKGEIDTIVGEITTTTLNDLKAQYKQATGKEL